MPASASPFVWYELMTSDAKAATAFYTQVATKTVRSIVSPLDRLALASPSEEAPDG